MNDRGFYKCKKCKLMICTETMILVDNAHVRKKISKCPHCFGSLINISKRTFENKKYKLFLNIRRKYYKKIIEMGVKYYE